MIPKKKYLFVLGCFAFVFFILFSYLVQKKLFLNIDFDTTVRLQDHMPRRFDQFFSMLSLIGEFQYMAIILGIILIATRKWFSAIFTFFLFGAIHIFELYGKTFVNHLPPPHFLLRTNLPFNFPQFYVRTENSYPSGHAARAFFITTVIFLIFGSSPKLSKNQKFILLVCLLVYDITMCVSRVYLGEHWTSDVIGGSLVGISFGLISGIAWKFQQGKITTT